MTKPLHIGLLLCHSFEDILDKVGGLNYSAMFRQQFLAIDSRITFSDFSVHEGHFPESVNQCDVWLVNGSPCGVYEDIEWIHTLGNFIKQLDAANKPTFGICFGHQLMAQVLGGKVELSHKGFGIGLTHNKVTNETSYMQPKAPNIDIIAFHQDQVVQLTAGAKVLATNDFCPNFMVQHNPHMLSIQGHPEFTKQIIEGLLTLQPYNNYPDLRAKVMATGNTTPDAALLFQWVINFYQQALSETRSLPH